LIFFVLFLINKKSILNFSKMWVLDGF